MMFTADPTALPALLLTAATAFAAEPAAGPEERAPTHCRRSIRPHRSLPRRLQPRHRRPSKPAAPGKRAQNDRLDLDTTIVTGNRELPKVLYIVPWKKADLGELPAQPFNTLLDEVLTPVDRDVFRREVTYYGVVSSGGNASAAAPASPGADPAAPARGDEK